MLVKILGVREKAKGEKEKAKKLINHGEYVLHLCSLWLIVFMAVILCRSSFAQENCIQDTTERVELKSGMVVLLKKNHGLPLINLFLCVLSGSSEEGKYSGSGISHFVEHMVFKGTKKRKPGELFKEIESCGGTINAMTSYDYTGYTITVPKEFAGAAIEILADIVMNASFEQDQLEREREVICKEIKLGLDHPQRYIARLLWQTAYTTHPYRHPIIGSESSLRNLSRDDLMEYYRTRYVPNKMILAIVGDFETESTLAYIRKEFETFQRDTQLEFADEAEPEQKQMRMHQEEFTSGMAYLVLGYHSVSLTDEDCFALDVLSTVLGQGESSRLYKLLCRKKNLAYSLQAYNYTPQDSGLFIISCFCKEPNRKRALSAIIQQINVLQKMLISEDELESAKNKITSGILFSSQTNASQAQDLAINEGLAKDYKFTERYLQRINTVSADDILRVANQYLPRSNLSAVSLVPREQTKKTVNLVTDAPHLQIGIEHLNSNSSRQIGCVSLQTSNAENAVKKYTLQSGATLLIKEKKELPLVTLTAVFRGGLRAENEETNGICNLVANLMDKGTEEKSAEEIVYLAESHGASILSFSGNNSFGITINLLSKDLDQMLALLAEMINSSTFPAREITRQKEKNIAALKAQDDNIFEAGTTLLKQTIYKQHPYRLQIQGTERSLKKLKRRDLVEFYRRLCVGKNMVLAVFGNVDAEQVRSKAEELFIDLNPGERPIIAPERDPALTGVVAKGKDLPKQQSLLLLGFCATTLCNPDRYALEIVSEILSQNSGRLFTQIREKVGLAYTLGAFCVFGLDPGYIVIYAATTSEHVSKAKEVILEQLNLIKQQGLSMEELAQAKRRLTVSNLSRQQSLGSWALQSALDELYGLGGNYFLEYAEKINEVKVEDIKDVANRYFTLSNYAQVIVGPQPLGVN